MPDREKTNRVEVYKDAHGEYRWRRVAANNKIVTDSAEGFVKHAYALESARAYNQDVTDVRDLTQEDKP